MNPLRDLFVVISLLTVTSANNKLNAVNDSLKSVQWLTTSDLENTAALNEVSWEKLEKMTIEDGAKLMQKWYHISQINCQLIPSFIPNPSDIPVYIFKENGEKETANLYSFVEAAQQDTNFGNVEVTVFITGLPSTTKIVKKVNHKLVQAYIERYNSKQQKHKNYKENGGRASSEESSSEWNYQKFPSGNLIVIDLGQTLDHIERLATLNADEVGVIIGKALVQLADGCNMPQGIIHVVAQGVAAHVAGAAGDEYTRLTGHKLRRITALDPSKILTKKPLVLTGLARGDAEFVDAIHTSVHSLGTLTRVGDIDFFPNGPCAGVPGAENIIEASMRATSYFAESVRPGNERNFPAVEANSFKQYKSNNGFGQRAFMGIATDYDLRGDYMLEVNEKNPFGMRAFVQEYNSYHQYKI